MTEEEVLEGFRALWFWGRVGSKFEAFGVWAMAA